MSHMLATSLFVVALFIGVLLLLETGRRVGSRRLAEDPKGAAFGPIDGAVFGLLGLLFAFTFSGAATRFDARRHLIVEEANAIGTAYLRLDLLPAAAQPQLRENFRQYVDARLAVYRAFPDIEAAKAGLVRAAALQNEIWTAAVAACREAGMPAAPMLLLPALNEMIDITTTRTLAAQTHAPLIIFAMLALLALTSALLAGYGMASGVKRSWLHMLGFATILALTVYVILDLEYPRAGLIRIDAVDQVLVGMRNSMK